MTIFGLIPKGRFGRASFAYTLLFVCVVIYFELFQVWTNAYSWSLVSPDDKDIKILLVADPQLLGEHGEMPLIGVFTRWHADRYVAQNYRAAMYRVKPDIVIFQGDLFDEGSTATGLEAARYLKRFHSVFQLKEYSRDDDKLMYIFLPGDNDVGGEGTEKIRQDKLLWFNSSIGDFRSPVFYQKANLDLKFLQKNFLFPHAAEDFLPDNETTVPTFHHRLTFVLSHYPCLQAYGRCSEFLTARKPTAFLSSHTHKSTYHQYNSEGKLQYILPELFKPGTDPIDGTIEAAQKMGLQLTRSSLKIDFRQPGSLFHEIVTPTCSYRMGERHPGIGLLTINSSGDFAQYQVLWLPNGFKPLYVYITFYILSKVLFTPWIFWKLLLCFWPRLKRFLNIKDGHRNASPEKTHLV